jgi:hypothetical protein
MDLTFEGHDLQPPLETQINGYIADGENGYIITDAGKIASILFKK